MKKYYNISSHNIQKKQKNITELRNIFDKDSYLFLKNQLQVKDNFHLQNYTKTTKIIKERKISLSQLINVIEGSWGSPIPFFITRVCYNNNILTNILPHLIINSINQNITLQDKKEIRQLLHSNIITLSPRGALQILPNKRGKLFNTLYNSQNNTIFFPTQNPMNEKNIFIDILGNVKKTVPLIQEKNVIGLKSLLLYLYLHLSKK